MCTIFTFPYAPYLGGNVVSDFKIRRPLPVRYCQSSRGLSRNSHRYFPAVLKAFIETAYYSGVPPLVRLSDIHIRFVDVSTVPIFLKCIKHVDLWFSISVIWVRGGRERGERRAVSLFYLVCGYVFLLFIVLNVCRVFGGNCVTIIRWSYLLGLCTLILSVLFIGTCFNGKKRL